MAAPVLLFLVIMSTALPVLAHGVPIQSTKEASAMENRGARNELKYDGSYYMFYYKHIAIGGVSRLFFLPSFLLFLRKGMKCVLMERVMERVMVCCLSPLCACVPRHSQLVVSMRCRSTATIRLQM